MKRKIALVLAGVLTLASGITFTSVAQDAPTPAQQAAAATETRQGLYKLLYFNLLPIAGMARGAPFDAEVAETNGRRIAALAPMIPDVMNAMDTREFDVETEALDIVWEDQSDFRIKAEALEEAANAFADAAATGDQRAAMGAFRGLGGGCGNCHDKFRVDTD